MRLVRAVRAAFAITSIFLAATGISASADTLSGRAAVIDGDTIAIPGVEPRIRP